MSAAARRRESLATPTGIQVSDAPPHSAEWHAQRLRGITATDVVRILCPGQYGTALDVWARKRGLLDEDPGGEAAYWGNVHEPNIANRWQEEHPRANVRAIGTLQHVDHPWWMASLDRYIVGCPDGDGPCGLECKSRTEWVAGKWRKDVPDEEYVQVQTQMGVTGFRHMHLALLLGGNRWSEYRVERNPEQIALIFDRAAEVWRHVQDGAPPPVEHSPHTLDSLNRIWPAREGQAEAPEADVRGLLAAWHAAKTKSTAANGAQQRAKDALDAATAALVERLGGAEFLFVPGSTTPAVQWKTTVIPAGTRRESVRRELRVIDKALLPGTSTTTDDAQEVAA